MVFDQSDYIEAMQSLDDTRVELKEKDYEVNGY